MSHGWQLISHRLQPFWWWRWWGLRWRRWWWKRCWWWRPATMVGMMKTFTCGKTWGIKGTRIDHKQITTSGGIQGHRRRHSHSAFTFSIQQFNMTRDGPSKMATQSHSANLQLLMTTQLLQIKAITSKMTTQLPLICKSSTETCFNICGHHASDS